MSGAPNTKDWKAKEQTDFAGGDRKITVTGEVEVGNLGSEPQLCRADIMVIRPDILPLELSVTHGGGGTVMNYKTAKFEEAVSEDQYRLVTIHFEGKEIETIEVEKIIS